MIGVSRIHADPGAPVRWSANYKYRKSSADLQTATPLRVAKMSANTDDSLYPIAVLIDELRSEELQVCT